MGTRGLVKIEFTGFLHYTFTEWISKEKLIESYSLLSKRLICRCQGTNFHIG